MEVYGGERSNSDDETNHDPSDHRHDLRGLRQPDRERALPAARRRKRQRQSRDGDGARRYSPSAVTVRRYDPHGVEQLGYRRVPKEQREDAKDRRRREIRRSGRARFYLGRAVAPAAVGDGRPFLVHVLPPGALVADESVGAARARHSGPVL